MYVVEKPVYTYPQEFRFVFRPPPRGKDVRSDSYKANVTFFRNALLALKPPAPPPFNHRLAVQLDFYLNRAGHDLINSADFIAKYAEGILWRRFTQIAKLSAEWHTPYRFELTIIRINYSGIFKGITEEYKSLP